MVIKIQDLNNQIFKYTQTNIVYVLLFFLKVFTLWERVSLNYIQFFDNNILIKYSDIYVVLFDIPSAYVIHSPCGIHSTHVISLLWYPSAHVIPTLPMWYPCYDIHCVHVRSTLVTGVETSYKSVWRPAQSPPTFVTLATISGLSSQ